MRAPAATACPSPQNYVTAVLGTTLLYRLERRLTFSGWQKDIGPAIGYGRLVTPTIAVELDAGVVFIKDKYSTTLLVPGVLWSFDPRLRRGAGPGPRRSADQPRAVPGIGVVQSFSNGIGVSLELNLSSTIGRGEARFRSAAEPGCPVLSLWIADDEAERRRG